MPRSKRIWYAGAVYHVMNRGNRRESIFREPADYYAFLSNLAEVKQKYPCRIYSICLMTNHFHILIKTEDIQIWKIMHRLQLMYAMDFNAKYNLSGHVFEKRYNCQLVEDTQYLLEVSRYIHLNPVKAAIVKEPADYEYSSYRLYVGDRTEKSDRIEKYKSNALQDLLKELVDPSFVLSLFGIDSYERYQKFTEQKISHQEQEKLIQKSMNEDE